MLLGPPGTKSPCKVHGSREKCHWGGRSPGPERVPGAHELLPHQVGGPGFSPRDAHQGRGGTRMEVPKDWQSPGPRRTEQGREGHRPQEKGAAGIREEGEARTAGGDSHSAVCELKTQALEKRGLLVSFSIRLRARLLASFGVKGTLCWGLCPRSWAMLLGQGWAGAGLEEFCSPAGGKGHLRSLSARCPRTGVTPQPGGARGPGSKTKSVSTTQQVTQISRMGLRVNSS